MLKLVINLSLVVVFRVVELMQIYGSFNCDYLVWGLGEAQQTIQASILCLDVILFVSGNKCFSALSNPLRDKLVILPGDHTFRHEDVSLDLRHQLF